MAVDPSSFFEEDEPIEKIREIMKRERTHVSRPPTMRISGIRLERSASRLGVRVQLGETNRVETAHLASAPVRVA